MNEIELFDLLRYGERITLECKEARNALPKAFWETYSSFANTIGGTVLLGIKENFEESDFEHRFTVQGVAAPHKIITDLWNTINSDKVSANILTDSNVYTIKVNGQDVVVVEENFTRLSDWLRKQGITVEPVPYREISKMGGLLRCSTLPLIRD